MQRETSKEVITSQLPTWIRDMGKRLYLQFSTRGNILQKIPLSSQVSNSSHWLSELGILEAQKKSTLQEAPAGESSWFQVIYPRFLHHSWAKLLHTLADENSDLQKKIGCINGIFQMFDRHHVFTSRPKSLSIGNVHANSINFERDTVDAIYDQRSAFQFQDSDVIRENGSSEKLTEASKVSVSSSCSSSSPLSSEVNREVQPEILVDDRVIFLESPTSDPAMSRGSGKHMGLDLRDVVRDSMYREVRGHNKREDSPRPSYGLKQSTPVDFHESCRALAKLDMKETSRYYVDSRGKSKSKKKLKELPKLSLDSSDHIDLNSGNKLSESLSRSSSMNKVSGSPKRPPSVVAKLMGLETLPGSPLARDKISMFGDNSDPFSRSLRENSLNRSLRFSPSSPRSLGKDPASSASPRWRNSDFVMKPLTSLKYPIEPAPWKQTDKNRLWQKQTWTSVRSLSRSQSMEGRLKDLEVKHSGKNLSALKEILEAMQSKGLFDTQKQPQCINLEAQRDYEMADSATSNHNSRDLPNSVMRSDMRGPIVIIKPARLAEKSGFPTSSMIPIHSLSGLHKTCQEEPVNVKRNSTIRKAANDRSPGNQKAKSCISSVDKKSSSRNARTSQVSRESTSKNSGSVSPKLQQMKHEHDKRSLPPTSPSDSSKSRKQMNRQLMESTTSPGNRRSRPREQKSLQQNDDQLSQMSNKSRTETEATVNIENDGKTPSAMVAAKAVVSNLIQNKSSPTFSEDGSSEHPSPVSVLNATIYKEIETPPVKIQTCEGSVEHCEEDRWNPAYSFSKTTSSFSPEMNRKKLQNVELLVQKLRRLNSSHDETSQDYIASLCENIDPNTDHRYISEILLASGLLLRDFGSGLTTFQLHTSGHPINPELFLVLEQTKGCSNSLEKLNRKLVFDAVNEMLVKKLPYVDSTANLWKKQAKVKKRVLSAHHLLKELCSEIETLQKQARKRSENFLLLEEEEEGFLRSILDEDLAQSEKWTDFDDVIPEFVLDLERLLFKDLVNEIVHGEIGRLKAKSRR